MRKKRSLVHKTLGKLFQTSPSSGRNVPAGSAEAPGRTGCGMGSVGLTLGFSKMSVLGISRGWHSGWGKQTNRSVQRHVGGMIFLLEELLFLHRAKKKHPAGEQELPENGRKLNGRTASAGLFFAFCQGKKKKLDKEMKFDSRYSRPKTGSQAGMGFFSLRIIE